MNRKEHKQGVGEVQALTAEAPLALTGGVVEWSLTASGCGQFGTIEACFFSDCDPLAGFHKIS